MLSVSLARVAAVLSVVLLSPSAFAAASTETTVPAAAQPPADFLEPEPLFDPVNGQVDGQVDGGVEGDGVESDSDVESSNVESSDVEGSAEDTEETAETANYSDGEISIDYPVTWKVEVDEAGDVAIANIPAMPTDAVETQIFHVASPPGPLVDANIDSFIEEGSAVSRYRSVTIDDQSALVIWLSERPDDLSNAIATFIDYGDNTIMLFSRYDAENVAAEDSILRLHSSFTNLATSVESAPIESAPPVESMPVEETEL